MEREDFYDFKASPGEHIPVNRDPILLPDEALPDAEIRAAVKAMRLRNGRTGGGSMMRSEDLKSWLRRAEEEEEAKTMLMLYLSSMKHLANVKMKFSKRVRLVDLHPCPQTFETTVVIAVP